MGEDGAGKAKWSSQRLETAYGDARNVVEAQRETLADIDEKAMRTVRLTLILAGLIVTTVEYAQPDFDVKLFAAGLGSILISVLAGMATYSESNLYLGPNRTYLNELRTDRITADQWDDDRLDEYARMVSTHSPSDLYTDPGPEYRKRIRDGGWNSRGWEQDLVATYSVWVDENSRVVRRNGWLLAITEALLVIGLVFVTAAVVF